jgi:hypothetical protein
MKKILSILLVISCMTGYSQDRPEYRLILDFAGMIKTYKFEFLRSESQNLIIASKAKPGHLPMSKNDSLAFVKLFEKPEKKDFMELIGIVEKYKEYEIDTLIINRDNSILNLSDSFAQDWKKTKERLELTADKRIILDGYTVKISLVRNQADTQVISAKSPSSQSDPQIFQLISELETFYRRNSKNPVIN